MSDDRCHALVHSDAHEHPTDELAVDLPRGRGAKLKADLCTQDVDRVQKLLLLRLGLAQQLAAPLGRSRSGQELRFLGVVLGTRAESQWTHAASWVLAKSAARSNILQENRKSRGSNCVSGADCIHDVLGNEICTSEGCLRLQHCFKAGSVAGRLQRS